MEYDNPLVLLPTAIVLILALWTRRALEPLVLGAFIGTLMIDPGNAPEQPYRGSAHGDDR